MPLVRPLFVCPDCDCKLVYPTIFEPAAHRLWRILLRCPNCEWDEWRELDENAVDYMECRLDREREELVVDFVRLVQSNMTDELERFAAALEANAILPMDF